MQLPCTVGKRDRIKGKRERRATFRRSAKLPTSLQNTSSEAVNGNSAKNNSKATKEFANNADNNDRNNKAQQLFPKHSLEGGVRGLSVQILNYVGLLLACLDCLKGRRGGVSPKSKFTGDTIKLIERK